ncbi:hypothetical protein BVI1335_830059 [Burkholderia vietnamiensis]|nr:hypothetical protein BVI1335_830059 [Burkholderia vietnamiensis]
MMIRVLSSINAGGIGAQRSLGAGGVDTLALAPADSTLVTIMVRSWRLSKRNRATGTDSPARRTQLNLLIFNEKSRNPLRLVITRTKEAKVRQSVSEPGIRVIERRRNCPTIDPYTVRHPNPRQHARILHRVTLTQNVLLHIAPSLDGSAPEATATGQQRVNATGTQRTYYVT